MNKGLNQHDASSAIRLKRRYAAEKRFRLYGVFALFLSALFLLFLLGTIFSSGVGAFKRTMIKLSISFDAEVLGVHGFSLGELNKGDYSQLLRHSLSEAFPEITTPAQKREIIKLFSIAAPEELRSFLINNPTALGSVRSVEVSATSDLDQLHKGNISRKLDAVARRISDFQLQCYDQWLAQNQIRLAWNWSFFTKGDSRFAELAGIGAAIMGSFFTLIVCLALCFPLGVAAAVYLEEFAPKNWWTEIIEVNINNLAAVPSIIFGLLGLAVFLNFLGLPRSTPLVGGMVLALMTLPTIIIACRAALKSVPPSIREGAMAMGASPMQVIAHHVLPLALPGTLTGTIIGLARALGETAPLLMIGMVAFIVDVPKGPLDPAAALPVQIYLWAESAERGFIEKTAAAIMIILLFLICMNATAVYLRNRYERRW